MLFAKYFDPGKLQGAFWSSTVIWRVHLHQPNLQRSAVWHADTSLISGADTIE